MFRPKEERKKMGDEGDWMRLLDGQITNADVEHPPLLPPPYLKSGGAADRFRPPTSFLDLGQAPRPTAPLGNRGAGGHLGHQTCR